MASCPRCRVPGALIAPRVLCLNSLCECYHKPSRYQYGAALMRGDRKFSGDDMGLIRLKLWAAEQHGDGDQA